MDAAKRPLDQDSQTSPHNVGRSLCLACSPRKGGNSDFAARRLVGIFNEVAGSALPGVTVQLEPSASSPPAVSSPAVPASPEAMDLLYLRENPVAACVSCGVCDHPGLAPCSLDGRRIASVSCPAVSASGVCAGAGLGVGAGAGAGAKDYGPELFDRLFSVPVLLITSPVYFYHVPTLFKAFIDRGQYWWMRKLQGHPRFNGLRAKRPAHVLLLCGRPRGERLFEGSLLSLKFFLSIFGFELQEPLLLRGVDGPKDLSGDTESLSALDAWAASLAAKHKV